MKRIALFFAICIPLLATSCGGHAPEVDKTLTYHYQNFFARTVMETYYLWCEEIHDKLYYWGISDNSDVDPIEKVKSMRYAVDGQEYDHWTQLTDDYESLTSTVSGVSTTYGCDFQLMWADQAKTAVVAIVTVVYKGSPAEMAGLRRGDVIVSVNGRKMTSGDYYEVITYGFRNARSTSLTLYDGRTVQMDAVRMYEDPVLCVKTFDLGSKKVGYLAYNSFTLASMKTLYDACKSLKTEGVTELVLDLRYNGGGYVRAEELLASMLAPEAAVKAGELYQLELLNKDYTAAMKNRYGEDACKRFFTTLHDCSPDSSVQDLVNTSDANIGITKLYALVTGGTASASESLLVGLMPYISVEVIGEQTHGKFCSGILIDAKDWSRYVTPSSEADNFSTANAGWGMYVMVGTYADKNGDNPCMPNGLVPAVAAIDVPYDGFQLGDEEETMLKVALQRAGKSYAGSKASGPARVARTPMQPHRDVDGFRIIEMKRYE